MLTDLAEVCRSLLSDQRSGTVVDELVWSVIIPGRGGGKGWGMMNNDFIMHVYDKNYLSFWGGLYALHY